MAAVGVASTSVSARRRRRGRRLARGPGRRMAARVPLILAAAVETMRASASGQPAVKLAFEFLVLTAARSGWRRGTRSTRPGVQLVRPECP